MLQSVSNYRENIENDINKHNKNYNISTITMSLQIPNCKLNLINIGKYLEIDDNILGIKYNYGKSSILKGQYLTSIYNRSKAKNQNKVNKNLFYNQVSIIVKLSKDNIINVKLFGNGSLHLTGLKNPSDGKSIICLIYEKLLNLCNKHDIILLTKDLNNVYLDNENNIYTNNNTNKCIIGFKYITDKNKTLYNINKKDYIIDSNTGLFISTKYENKRTRTFLNLNGEKIGTSRIELLKNKSKLYKNNSNIHFDYQNGFIYYDGDGKSNIIGKIINQFITQNSLEENNCAIIEHKYNCNPFLQNSVIYPINEFSKLTDETLQIDINCINIYFKLDFELNRQRLFKELLKLSYITEYKPEKYSGVKLRYKISKNKQLLTRLGICTCTNKCICNHVTFVIFQSGNIIASGFKSINSIEEIVQDFNNLIMSLKSIIKMKTFL